MEVTLSLEKMSIEEKIQTMRGEHREHRGRCQFNQLIMGQRIGK